MADSKKKNFVANDTASCCLPLCKSYQPLNSSSTHLFSLKEKLLRCKEGWHAALSQQDLPGQSEAECCTQECALFAHLCVLKGTQI